MQMLVDILYFLPLLPPFKKIPAPLLFRKTDYKLDRIKVSFKRAFYILNC